MGHTIGFKVETPSPERRDKLLNALIDLMNTELAGADELTITYATEGVMDDGTEKKTSYRRKWKPGQSLPSLKQSFGIGAEQASMFEMRGGSITLRTPFAGLGSSASEAPPSESARQENSAGLGPFRRTIEDLEAEHGYGDDDTEHTT